jgi:hypothetical protein
VGDGQPGGGGVMRAALVVLLLVASCGDGDDAPLDAPVAVDAGCSLLGGFGAMRNDAGNRDGITFRNDGFFVITRDEGAMVTGTYVVTGSMIMFTDQIGEPPGAACTVSGSYSYTMATDCRTISFLNAGDTCLARTSILHNATFARD